ncbi:MAG: hypothetical protein ACFBSG_04175 [Leptolyngbyaceae cyanobacterium]
MKTKREILSGQKALNLASRLMAASSGNKPFDVYDNILKNVFFLVFSDLIKTLKKHIVYAMEKRHQSE